MPRDAWLLNRSKAQPRDVEGFSLDDNHFDIRPILEASTLEDYLLTIEGHGRFLRLNTQAWPTAYRCASVSTIELEAVRQIGNIVRQGRILRLSADQVVLEHGSYTPVPDTLFVDCTADGLAKLPPRPIFEGNTLTLQPIRICQQVFSAASIAHVEATYEDDETKNSLCGIVPHPNVPIDALVSILQATRNEIAWAERPKTVAWLQQARLNWFGIYEPPMPEDTEEAEKLNAAKKAEGLRVCAKVEQLVALHLKRERKGAVPHVNSVNGTNGTS